MKRLSFAAWLAACVLTGGTALAQDGAVKIGILTDQNGPFAVLTGDGSLAAARLAIEDMGGSVLGKPIEVIIGDHQLKADVGSAIATRWYDENGVDAIFDIPVSSVSIAVEQVAKERNKVVVVSGAGSASIVGEHCGPTAFLWAYNTYSQASALATAVTQAGGDKWFFITSDYTFGHEMEATATKFILESGGTVLGSARHPLNTADFSSYILQAIDSGANVIGIANGGADTANAIKQAHEFGATANGQKLAAMILLIKDVAAVGQDKMQGLQFVAPFYWNMNDEARAFSDRFAKAYDGNPPTYLQTAVYSSVLHYLKAVKETGTDEGTAVAAAMHRMPVQDVMTDGAKIRDDGYLDRAFHLFRVKAPAESTSEWDYFELVSTVPPGKAALPTENSGCSLLSK